MRRTGPSAHVARTGSGSLTSMPRLAAVTVVISLLVLAGCMTGERPTLGTTPTASGTETGDPNVDAVLTLLDGVANAVFTAQYTATLRFGGTVSQVVVTQTEPLRHAVTIGDTRFLTEPTGTRTCTVSTGTCVDGIDQQPVSDSGVTADLVFGDVAKRLRRFAGARTAATTVTSSTIAGQPATCVDLPLGTNTATFCALGNGVLGRLVDGDITVELTTYSASPDLAQFELAGAPIGP